eukprot:CAMPEP_0174235266 /NCGR_PEP_ID=MMETSP0417-20130205/4772_1 /TAXON_ID=242541 /ORGANISM="Mayorella sp, Strain BSH-02190019" /LENGTH=348 /DNA_ID=CAMNT_0015313751 /DNA_START=167 /DNA_END=1210 /DNA_ORIENTATION=+
MDLSSLLRERKTPLKKVATVDHSAPYLKDSKETVEKRLDEYIAGVRAVDCEAYYDQLQEYTYRSEFVPISIEEARALIGAYRTHARPDLSTHHLTGEQQDLLKALCSRVDSKLGSCGFREGGAFVKLSSRSPKDATSVGERCMNLFEQFLRNVKEKEHREVTSNDRFQALNYAHIYAMRSHTGEEALSLLSRSERICTDLELALERPVEWTQKIVIREWMCIPLQFEFRGFVRERRLNALSQYYHKCFYQDVHENHELCRDLICDFYERIKDQIPIASCICDFVVDLDQKRVLIVELNPFDPLGTDAAMFNWKTDHEVMFNGPFEFRWESKEVVGLEKHLTNEWKTYM